ncbi:hypothetical protein QAD02_015538 [Eretmocerus hayati]|uniref:Uncharacterized protein n=1 Tax=Eretmocerus hayati TaxID=131215 RepID=A0ACC2PA72_9HYME|nr:hypothetical protein QAD02_015538 [Eretmocerus hayati]
MASTSGNQGQKSVPMSTETQVTSYASATSTRVRPGKEQAIVIDAKEGLCNDDYLDGLEDLIELSNVRYISKISGNRICIFLSTEEIVKQLVDKRIQVQEYELKIRSWIEKNRRVVISNVNPTIPNDIILRALKEKGINPVSTIIDVKASLTKPGRGHIQSFRRQTYIKEEEEKLLPESLMIHHDNVNYWIYFTTDSTNCYICKQSGHIAKMCPSHINTTGAEFPALGNNNNLQPSHSQTDSVQGKHTNNNTPQVAAVKRPLETSSSSSGSVTTENTEPKVDDQLDNSKKQNAGDKKKLLDDKEFFHKPKPKKMRNSDNPGDENSDTDAETIAEATNQEQFEEFLEKSKGSTSLESLLREYTRQPKAMILKIQQVYSTSTDGVLKARLTKLRKKIKKIQDPNSKDSESESETSTQNSIHG